MLFWPKAKGDVGLDVAGTGRHIESPQKKE
jgi:hypothetical protein